MDVKQNLLLFFDRPKEPCFMPKGEDKISFQIPDHYYPEKFGVVKNELSNRFGEESGLQVPVKDITIPDLRLPLELPYDAQFSLFIPKHSRIAARLIHVFLSMPDLYDLESICTYCQLRLNPYLFNYCLSVALLHRPDTKGLDFPNFAESFPEKFFDPSVFNMARKVTTLVAPGEKRMPITIPRNLTASDSEPEQGVAYFREDIGINLHHWHWHLVYPFEGDMRIVNKDRRGELFYYMHQQIIARFDAERMCNGLRRVKPYDDVREPIAEAYFPKLNSQVAGRTWPPRFANTSLRDLDRPVELIRMDVFDLDTARQRFLSTVDQLSVLMPDGSRQPLDEASGIDVLGNIMEASILSVNAAYYGSLHNRGHVFFAAAHDPDYRHLEQFGVMGDPGTAMRDPVFYRWHKNVDDLFHLYKSKLPPYGPERLVFPGVEVTSISLEGPGGDDNISTLWEQSTIDLRRGLDFMPGGSVPAIITHLQHEEFNYKIEVNNTSGEALMGTVRIFIAPTVDEDRQALSFDEQRKLMIELDKFSQSLNPGRNTIQRRSVDSSVTIPYERTFRNQALRAGEPGSAQAAGFDFCGCGWPHHMLVPKGTAEGYPMVLFAMVSNWNEDRVEQDLVGSCSDAASYCGIRDRKYPDKRAMGYPFDRPASAASLNDFLQPNMAVTKCTITFTDRTRVRGQQ